ncbi:MAG: NAD-dependent epimerase/dehydratase family protein [Nitrosarchaeum sp.]
MDPILISGTNGFLGSHLAQFFIKNHTKTYGIFHGSSQNPNVEKIHDDISSIQNMPNDVSTILHFAALTDIQICEKNPNQCFDINVNGTRNMLELARKNDSSFIFASSSHVYGKPSSLPINENFSLNPLSIHAKSKVKAESICEEYTKLYGMKIIIIRIFSIYGPRSPPYSIISRVINQILKNQKIVLGNINTKRDFLHISDFLSAIDILIKKNLSGCSKFNIGYGKSFSIKELSTKLLEISQKNLSIESEPHLIRNNDIEELVCDNSKLKQLGWTPKLTFDEGLTQVFQWFQSNYESNSKNLSKYS